MKKAKIILTIIATAAISSASLAFKANRVGNLFYINSINNQCVSATMLHYIADTIGGTSTTLASTQSVNIACPIITVRPYL